MSKLATRAELIKLARDFQAEPEELEPLSRLGVEPLAHLRHLCADQLFERYSGLYKRLAIASGLLPARLAILLGEKVFGPYLGGRIGSQLETARALKFAGMASIPYLAQICETIDPRRVLKIIHGMSSERITAVSAILIENRDFITMGKFVDCLTESQLRVMLDTIDDPEVLLHTAFYTEGKARLEAIVHMVDDTTLQDIIHSSVQSGTFTEALSLITHLGTEGESRLANLAAELGEPVLNELVRIAATEQLWPEILPLVLQMSEANQVRVMQVRSLLDAGVLEGLLRAGQELQLWEASLPMLAHTSAEFQEILLKIDFLYEADTVRSLLDAANRTDSHGTLLRLLEQMNEADQQRIHAATEKLDHTLLQDILRTASRLPGAEENWLYRKLLRPDAT